MEVIGTGGMVKLLDTLLGGLQPPIHIVANGLWVTSGEQASATKLPRELEKDTENSCNTAG